jgi:O-antigen ligase
VLLHRDPRRIVRAIAALSIALSISAVLVVRSRVAALTMVGSLGCAAFLLRPRLGVAWGAGVAVALLGLDGLLGFPLVSKFSQVLDTRIAFWLVAWEMFLDAPLLGRGPRTFGLFYHAYLRELRLPDWLPVDPGLVPWAHNLYVEGLAEQGLIGLAGLLLVLWAGLRLAWGVHAAGAETGVLGSGALAGLLGFCIAGALELTLLRLWVVTVLFLLLGVIARLSTIPAADVEEEQRCERSVTLARS